MFKIKLKIKNNQFFKRLTYTELNKEIILELLKIRGLI